MIQSFRDLEVYKESYQLMLIIHREVVKFPEFEKFDLILQIRKASKSIPSNIAERWAKRAFEKEFKRYLDIALGSANEMEVHISIARDLNYWKKDFCNETILHYQQLGGKLLNIRKNWKTF